MEAAFVGREDKEKNSSRVLRKIYSFAAVNRGNNNTDNIEPEICCVHMIMTAPATISHSELSLDIPRNTHVTKYSFPISSYQ